MVQAAKEAISEFGCHRVVRETRGELASFWWAGCCFPDSFCILGVAEGWVPLLEGAAEPHKPFRAASAELLSGNCRQNASKRGGGSCSLPTVTGMPEAPESPPLQIIIEYTFVWRVTSRQTTS